MKKGPGKISASMMCADLIHLKETINLFEENYIDFLHIDIMDGEFVPNLGLGVDYIRNLRRFTNIPLDLHMMVHRPEEKLEWLGIQPSDCVSLHYESTAHVQRALEQIRKYSCKVMLAINPATPVFSIEEVLEYIDGVTLLTVNPGFAGQKLIHSCIKKAEKLKNLLVDSGFPDMLVEVDGNISFDNARIFKDRGADIFVAGTSSIFSGSIEYMKDNILHLQSIIH